MKKHAASRQDYYESLPTLLKGEPLPPYKIRVEVGMRLSAAPVAGARATIRPEASRTNQKPWTRQRGYVGLRGAAEQRRSSATLATCLRDGSRPAHA